MLLRRWVKIYRDEGAEGLGPKAAGRPTTTDIPSPVRNSETEKLRGEVQRLQAENAYLKKFGP